MYSNLKTNEIPFMSIDWSEIPKEEYNGEEGKATWQTIQFSGLRVRVVEYSAGYIADHWCQKGHIVHCLEGEVINELEGEESSFLTKGMSYIVSDDMSSHRSVIKSATKNGVKLLIIDGDFLS